MTEVIIKSAEYEYDILKPVVFEFMNALGGKRISQDSRVIIKPNLLAAAVPEKAIVTHPMVIRAVVEFVNERGARPQISDSPAIGTFQKILDESGITQAIKGLNVECREFKGAVNVDIGRPFNSIEIARDAMEADFLINLPKLKTHAQMKLTLGVKNTFGCIIGMKKPEWHLRSGVDRELFADLLARISKAVKPDITIMDGILSMEGQGPGKGGTPRKLGVVMGSRSPAAIDIAVCKMIGLDPLSLLTNKMSALTGPAIEDVTITGELPAISEFELPVMSPAVFGPVALHSFIRKHLVQRPVADPSLCRMCGECRKYCPAHAITQDKKKIYFDYDTCIRCYCCLEVCPHGALTAKESMPGSVVRRLLRIR
ncbi:MAG: DUF362 domain-containing protein [Nitrospiraceae bacterium]|nr:MAG: DUF362 domain-containing protein [Nitrospiraceae bacterium]